MIPIPAVFQTEVMQSLHCVVRRAEATTHVVYVKYAMCEDTRSTPNAPIYYLINAALKVIPK